MTTIHRVPEIATLAEALSYLGLGETAEDKTIGQLQSLKRGAEAAVRKYLGGGVVRATYTDYYPRGNPFDLVSSPPLLSEGGRPTMRCYHGPDLMLRRYPLRSITSIYEDSDGNFGQKSGAFDSNALLVEGDDYCWPLDCTGFSKLAVVRRIGTYWPSRPGSIKVTYVAGWTKHELHGDTDDETKDGSAILLSVLKTIAEYWGDKKQAEAGVSGAPGPIKSESIADRSVTYDTSQSGAGIQLPEDVKIQLRGYRRLPNTRAMT